MEDDEFNSRVRKEILNEDYFYDIKRSMISKSRMKLLSDLTEIFSYIFAAIGVILTFASGFFNNIYIAFAAGCMSTLAMVLLKLSSYFLKESKERTQQVNILLRNRNFNQIPDITIEQYNGN
jgi:hypothetical protein